MNDTNPDLASDIPSTDAQSVATSLLLNMDDYAQSVFVAYTQLDITLRNGSVVSCCIWYLRNGAKAG